MKNLSNFNLLIIILLFSSCRQQPFTGTVHIIPYPNQIAIGTQYRPIGKIDFDIYRSRHFEPTNSTYTSKSIMTKIQRNYLSTAKK